MWQYTPPLREFRFVVEELLDVQGQWAEIPAFADLGGDTIAQILDAASEFVTETLAPANAAGDIEGCVYRDGRVVTPPGFAQAYREYCDGGWPALACDVRHGGQGLPQLLNAILYEMLYSANHAWTMYPGIVHGGYECLRAHASPQLIEHYLPKIVSGEWLCTMCLTEPQAGSDVGLISTRAESDMHGGYRISGSKIFISGGEHDLTTNIIHLVLARLPDAPAGTKGLSLFLVPKFIGAEAGEPNAVYCDGIERKMGLKGSSTCSLRFDGARGWLVGEPHRGLAAMFVMMNSARLYVGLQGLGHAEMAQQNAVRYAHERRQMRAVGKSSSEPRSAGAVDPIALQPAIGKLLMTLRAFVEGERAVGLWTAHLLDVAESHPDERRRSDANELLSLLTPIVKGFFTENGFSLSSAALQVWGGYGYLRDFGIEQTLRDSRAAMIYEGTNEIQAVDLLVRKIIGDRGRRVAALFRLGEETAQSCRDLPACRELGDALSAVVVRWRTVTQAIIDEAGAEPAAAYRIASDYLRLAGLCLLGVWWARIARLASARLDEPFYRSKFATARFYFDQVLPETGLRLALIDGRHAPLPSIELPA
jgi:alkylation response protein AidB-like acyl-CoA dehydrogenase